ncbi:hypothetical protein EIP91_001563 [Steccherinum ochraceum]|uniref:Enoyl reductase (ER) domain-containing protein n=1 Tax=Steccherinum ochraceum TaxID=92696 RepID=A0A4V2MWI3_9APHY|nr:hypothetical protein EIP91_001563 [Steccherinum ochraceum]
MSVVTNGRLLYIAHPTGFQVPGVHTKYVEEQIDLDNVALNGGVLVRTVALSSDPYVRIRMRDPKIPSTFPPLIIGRPLENYGVGVIVRSEMPEFKAGDSVYGFFETLDKHPEIPASVYVGTLGMPGKTAYAGGPVGTHVIEYARHTNPHLKIIASAGSPQKLEVLKQAGADVIFNYKTTDTAKILAEHGPVDIYWDHVGGEILDAALANMQHYGIILRVATSSGYNSEQVGLKNIHAMIEKGLTMFGFIVGLGEVQEKALINFKPETTKLVLDGVIKVRETKYEGLTKAGEALAEVHHGQSLGKPVVIVAEN